MRGTEEVEIISWWKALCDANGYPERRHLNPVDISKHLPNIAIMERRGENEVDDYIVRLAGTRVDEMAGVNLKGLRSSEFNDEVTDALFRKSFAKVIDLPCGATFHRKIISPDGKMTGITMTILPFKGKTDDTPQILFYNRYDEESGFVEKQSELIVKPIERWEYVDIGFGVPEE